MKEAGDYFGNRVLTANKGFVFLKAEITSFLIEKIFQKLIDYFIYIKILYSFTSNELHITWINKWNTTLVELEEYVRKYHRTGLAWNISGTVS